MNHKVYCVISGIIFIVVAVSHAGRVVYGWHVQVEDVFIPMWVSWIGVLIPAVLSSWAFRIAMTKR